MLPALPQKVLCQLATEEDDAAAQPLMEHMGVPPKEYHLKVLRKVLALYCSLPKSCLCWCVLYVIMSTYMKIVLFPVFQMVALLQENVGKSCSSLSDVNQRYSTVETMDAANYYIHKSELIHT